MVLWLLLLMNSFILSSKYPSAIRMELVQNCFFFDGAKIREILIDKFRTFARFFYMRKYSFNFIIHQN